MVADLINVRFECFACERTQVAVEMVGWEHQVILRREQWVGEAGFWIAIKPTYLGWIR